MQEKGTKVNEKELEIKFYIPKSETIPTDLALYVGETYVIYGRIQGGFRFEIYEKDEKKALEIAKAIADQMIDDHDESHYGVTWETVDFKVLSTPLSVMTTTIDWLYRVRDSY